MFSLPRSILTGLILWVLIVAVNYLRTGKIKGHFKFSVRNYYILMSAFLAGYVISAFQARSFKILLFLLFFALMGVVGETLFSFWWHVFFEKKFWVYKVETFVHSYTSFLNFIPWAVGGMLFLNIVQVISQKLPANSLLVTDGLRTINLPFYLIFGLGVVGGLLCQIAIWLVVMHHKGHDFKFKEVNLQNYLFFCLPFLLGLTASTILYGEIMLVIAFWFALVAAAAEYLFGKAVEFFISKKLWTYSYWAFDNGHFTPLSLVPFSLAGFYFWGIALIYQALR